MDNIFVIANRAYDDCIITLNGMTKLFQEFAIQQGVDYNPRVTLNQFDVILQYSMLQIALADGYLDKPEVEFIMDITKYSDFCTYLNQRGFNDITWDDIFHANESLLKDILAKIENEMIELSHVFVNIFSVFDATTEYDFLADLRKDVLDIMFATARADGYAETSELKEECLIFSLLDQIQREKDQMPQTKNQTKVSDKNTLKSFYVKKN